MPLPFPDEGGGKEDRGRVLVVGGGRETPGALVLAGTAALRAGALSLSCRAVGLTESGNVDCPRRRPAHIGVASLLNQQRGRGRGEAATNQHFSVGEY